MSDVVLKAINTVNRRLRVGDAVSETDDLTPHTLAGLKAGGFVGPADPEPASSDSRFTSARALSGDDE